VAVGPRRERGGGAAARQDALWRAHALKSLPALMRATRMLVCGEDLGMIPACVHPVMAQLGLVGARLLAARHLPLACSEHVSAVPSSVRGRVPYVLHRPALIFS
jgi:hypothetical protein